MTLRERLLYRLACWWLDSPRVQRLGQWIETNASRGKDSR